MPHTMNENRKSQLPNVWGGFALAIVGAVLQRLNALASLPMALLPIALVMATFFLLEKGARPAAIACAAANLALTLYNLRWMLNPSQVAPVNFATAICALVISVMLLLLALGALEKKGRGFFFFLVAVCALVRMVSSLSYLFMGYQLDFIPMAASLCAAIGPMIMTVYGFTRILTEKMFKAFTVCLGIAVILVLVASIAAFILTGGARVDNDPKPPLEEAQEWVYNNFRVDSDGNLYLD
ncbi:MAG: hypothetical protein IJE07_10465 [Clostridia bacterium]|nr:hypothetical protein [Clostridia bacterium]